MALTFKDLREFANQKGFRDDDVVPESCIDDYEYDYGK